MSTALRSIGKYELRQRLARSHLNEVWLAQDSHSHSSVILKVFYTHHEVDSEVVRHFISQAEAVAPFTIPILCASSICSSSPLQIPIALLPSWCSPYLTSSLLYYAYGLQNQLDQFCQNLVIETYAHILDVDADLPLIFEGVKSICVTSIGI